MFRSFTHTCNAILSSVQEAGGLEVRSCMSDLLEKSVDKVSVIAFKDIVKDEYGPVRVCSLNVQIRDDSLKIGKDCCHSFSCNINSQPSSACANSCWL